MEDKLLVRREGARVFNGSYKLFSAVFRLTILVSKFLRWVVAFLYFLLSECETGA